MTALVESFTVSTAQPDGSNQFAISYPADVTSGDLLVLLVGRGNAAVTDPSDWTQQAENATSLFSSLTLFTKVADGSETGDLTIQLSTTIQQTTYMLRVTGHGGVDAASAVGIGNVAASVTATDDDTLLLTFATSKDTASPPYTIFTAPTGMTLGDQDQADNGQQVTAWAYETISAGASGTREFPHDGGAVRVVNLAIAPGVPATPASPIQMRISGEWENFSLQVRIGGEWTDAIIERVTGTGEDPPLEAIAEPSAADMAYDVYGPTYRSDGAVKDGVVIGAAPFGAGEDLPDAARIPAWTFDFLRGARFGTQVLGYANMWGQVFPVAGSSFDCRLEVANPTLLVRVGTTWEDLFNEENPVMQGAFWDDTFRPVASVKDIQTTAGGQSVDLSPFALNNDRVTWHWWYGMYPRPAFPVGTNAVFMAARMRLIGDGDFIGSISCDSWNDASGNNGGAPAPALVQPRMKILTDTWQWFTGHWYSGWYGDSSYGPDFILANAPSGWN